MGATVKVVSTFLQFRYTAVRFLLAPGSTLKVKAISTNKLDSSIEEFSL